jgi:hypothetical protein
MLKDRQTERETTDKSQPTFSTFGFAPTLKADRFGKTKRAKIFPPHRQEYSE